MRFDHVGILVRDLDAAKAFAADVLGLGAPTAEFEAPDQGVAGAFYEVGGAQIEFFTVANTEDRLPEGAAAAVDHFAVRVGDLEAEQVRLAGHGVKFRGPGSPDPLTAPIEVRGKRHLWTDKSTSGGFMVQLIEDPSIA